MRVEPVPEIVPGLYVGDAPDVDATYHMKGRHGLNDGSARSICEALEHGTSVHIVSSEGTDYDDQDVASLAVLVMIRMGWYPQDAMEQVSMLGQIGFTDEREEWLMSKAVLQQ